MAKRLEFDRSAVMRAKGFATLFANVAPLSLSFVIWSGLPSVTADVENNPAATSDMAPSANVSAAADVPAIKITSFAHLRELSGLSNDAEWIRPAAFYSKSEHLIYLADNWDKDDLVDQSILVHELVHHLQIEHHIQFACWGRYEAQAYELQVQWLRAQGVKDPHDLLHASKASIESLAECP